MPTAHTVTTIYNMALDLIVELPVSSPSDDTPYARWLNRNYQHYVRATLRQQPWNFAIELHALDADVDVPAARWRYSYTLPNGWLRVLPPTYDGERGGNLLPYEVLGSQLFMNQSGPRSVYLVMDRQSPGDWDDLFAMLIAAKLANGMAHRFTAKTKYVELTKMAAEEAFAAAEEINSFEGTPMPNEEFDIIRIRGGA